MEEAGAWMNFGFGRDAYPYASMRVIQGPKMQNQHGRLGIAVPTEGI